MDGLSSTALTTRSPPPPQAIPRLPDEVIVRIATFCDTSEGMDLYCSCRGFCDALHEGVRKVQIVLISGIAKRLKNSQISLLDNQIVKRVKEAAEVKIEEIKGATTLTQIAKSSIAFMEVVAQCEIGEYRVHMHPFYSMTEEGLDQKYQFIPFNVEDRICKALISINGFLIGNELRLAGALRLMRNGTFDQTEESSKMEREGKNALLAALALEVGALQPFDLPLFADIVRRMQQEDLQGEILSHCIENYPQCSPTNRDFLNFLIEGEFLFLLPPEMQVEIIEQIYRVNQETALMLAFRSSEPLVKKKVLMLEIYSSTMYQMHSIPPARLFQILDIARSIPEPERKDRMFVIIDRLEKVCRPHQADFASFNASWESSFRSLYQDEPTDTLTTALLRILLISEEWEVEPTNKIVEDSWKLLNNRFMGLNFGICAYILLIHASSYVRDEEMGKEVFKIIFQEVGRISYEGQKTDFMRLLLVQGLDHLKENEFVSYEYLIDQIKSTIIGLAGYRSRMRVQEDFRLAIRSLSNERREGRGLCTKFYVLAGSLLTGIAFEVEKDRQIRELYEYYKNYALEEDPTAKKMMRELVHKIRDEVIKGFISWTE